ncbi:hypothetical protein C9J48_20420 [Photobacterium profundum]|uniref:Uncharacterized protein n=1 Tax=Photobacterium profundum 3TCK TaxID=314280 RepID=Q1Z4Z0_9GAMM|nr:hypothetical protein [Photobacterium profundum]EAS43481.1 hypothetical protein P3TCK_01454 [Photobacterium profundum 3TCK]PSV60264.1 hypothetical protein C9J48_20420 [Photobacterium profundum]
MNTEQKLNQAQLKDLKRKLNENEENIKACLWMLEISEMENPKWEEEKHQASCNIAYLQDRLNQHRNLRRELILNIKKLEVIL